MVTPRYASAASAIGPSGALAAPGRSGADSRESRVAHAGLRERRGPRLSRHVRPPTLMLPPGGRRQNGHVRTRVWRSRSEIPKHPAWGDLCRVDAARGAGHRSSLSSVLKQLFRGRALCAQIAGSVRCSPRRPERSVCVCVLLNILRSTFGARVLLVSRIREVVQIGRYALPPLAARNRSASACMTSGQVAMNGYICSSHHGVSSMNETATAFWTYSSPSVRPAATALRQRPNPSVL